MSRRLNIKTFCAAVASVVCVLSSAQAADLAAPYDPGILGDQKVEFASGWYIRGDVGYEQASIGSLGRASAVTYGALPLAFDGSTNRQNAYIAGLGGGYKFNNWLRSDVTGDIRKSLGSATYNAVLPCQPGACILNANSSLYRYDVMANGYLDLGTWSAITPYVGVGVGATFGRLSATTALQTQAGLPYGSGRVGNDYVNLAWALMVGFAIDVADHVKLDIGYRYFNGGRLYLQTGTANTSTSLVSNELRVGLRYMID